MSATAHFPPPTRAAIGVPAAFLVTVVLFLFMRSLVTPPDIVDQEGDEAVLIEIGRQQRDENIRINERTKPERPEAIEPPPPPPSRAELEQETDPGATNFELPNLGVNVDAGSSLNTDSTVQPLVRIPPEYPERAAQRGVEGYAVVCFDVDADGKPFNVEVCGEDPPGYFGRAAVRAVERWKYKPKIENGQPVPRRGLQINLSFNLDDE